MTRFVNIWGEYMSEAYLKVEVVSKGMDDKGNLCQVRIRNMDGECYLWWVREENVINNIPDKESIQNELMNSLRYVANFMTEKERESVFNASSVYGVICSCDAQKIIDGVRKVRDYPASGKIYSQKRDGEDVLCMVLGVDKDDWVCYTEKNRRTYITTVDDFLGDWTYTGECKEKEVDAIYDALK